MSKYEPKEGYGGLFKETEKKSENGPDYRGNIMLGGVLYEIAGWKKEGKSGTFLSLKGQIPRQRQEPRRSGPQEDDRIPF